ncbi:MAG: MlaD family protein [Bacteroidaceae bacterium]|nr:MlaD family protein [Bacteroidaceae bacterium]
MKISKEIRIGLVSIIAILIIYFGMIFLKGLKLKHTNNVYYVRMENVNGLLKAGDVICNGLKIGTVKDMTYFAEAQEIIVAAELDEGFTLTKGSTANIQKDMLGAPKLNLVLGPDASQHLNVGDTISGIGGSGDVLAEAGKIIPDIKDMMPKIDSLISALNQLANDPALANSLHNVENVTAQLQTSTNQLNEMVAGINDNLPQLMGKANSVMTNLDGTTQKLNNVDIATITSNANKTIESANKAIENVNAMTGNINSKLSNPNSTLGKLMDDGSMYDNLNSTFSNASSLLEDFKAHPKRYVHFSLFGKKDQ